MTTFYRIIETATHLEYHTGSEQDVRKGFPYCTRERRVPLDSSIVDRIRENWEEEAQLLEFVEVS